MPLWTLVNLNKNKIVMIEIRIRDLVCLVAVCALLGLSFICFTQRRYISNLKQAIEQRDSLLKESLKWKY